VMLVCYVFFPGGIGGGDVKLLAMIGTFLGLYHGLEALLWTFVLGGCQALIGLVWKLGALTLMRQAMSALWYVIRTGGQLPLPTEPEQQVSANLFLSPSALLAVLLVRIPALFQ
jgi:Flp pilus assembly protein protease CpaA